MSFHTKVELPNVDQPLSYGDSSMTIGSCFAEHFRTELGWAGFEVAPDAFGTLFNPVSIAKTLRWMQEGRVFTREELTERDGRWFHFDWHSSMSGDDPDALVAQMNQSVGDQAQKLKQSRLLVITLGSALVWRLKDTEWMVANCHKFPRQLFDKIFLSPEEIVAELKPVLTSLLNNQPDLRVLFTVSPVRHWREGAILNQRSKGSLLVAVHELVRLLDGVQYFPSYEIMMDELRDYRFYKDDMLHPSDVAVKHIWKLFSQCWIDEQAEAALPEWERIRNDFQHLSRFPKSEAHQNFIQQRDQRVAELRQKYPRACFDEVLAAQRDS